MDNSVLEKKIRKALAKKAEGFPLEEARLQAMQSEIFEKIDEMEKENMQMKLGKWKKTAIAAAVVCALGTVTAFGLGRATTMTGHSSQNEAVYRYEEAVKQQETYDKAYRFPETFTNGYAFQSAVPQHLEAKDENGTVLEKAVTMHVTYEKDGMEKVSLSADRVTMDEKREAEQTMTLEDGTVLRYSSLINKFVPPDYVPTEEEKKAFEEGTLNLAYGSSQVEVMTSASVTWEKDGLSYILFAFTEKLTPEEMLKMAKEAAEF